MTGTETSNPPGTVAAEGPGDSVPDGTIAEILVWVDDDADRAQEAYDVEVARESPRTTLLDELIRRGATP